MTKDDTRRASLAGAADFLRLMRRTLGARLPWLFLLALGGAMLEGLGLAALVPLLAVLGDATGATGGLAAHLHALSLEVIGRPLDLPMTLTVFAAIILARAGVMHLREMEQARARLEVLQVLRRDLVAAVAGARWSYLLGVSKSGVAALLLTDMGRVSRGTTHVFRLPAQVLMLLVQVGLALAVAPLLVGVTVLLGGVLAWATRIRGIHRAGERLSVAHGRMSASTLEFLSALKLAKSQAGEPRYLDVFLGNAGGVQGEELGFIRSWSRSRLLFQAGAGAATVVLVYVAADIVRLSLGELLLLAAILARLLPLVQGLRLTVQTVMHTLPAYQAVRTVTAACREAAEAPPLPDARFDTEEAREVRLENVSFRYGGRVAVRDVSATVKAGCMTAIVGRSGAGKTTLADLAMGLLSPDEGRVLVDGSPLAPGSLSAWRGGIGYVPQETVLFAGTVRDNLAMLAPEAGEPMMWDALEAADLKHRVMEMPGGLDTDIGERGSTLSGGERQRLALARALIRRPRFLVLDEATSELDPVSQRAIRRALERLKGQTTLLVIAHRLSTIRAADTILVMEGGRLIDQGHWDDLARREIGAFHDLLDAETVL